MGGLLLGESAPPFVASITETENEDDPRAEEEEEDLADACCVFGITARVRCCAGFDYLFRRVKYLPGPHGAAQFREGSQPDRNPA